MKNPILAIILISAALLTACADKKKTVDGTSPSTGAQAALNDPRFGGAAPADSLVISMERTPCFGQCKAYRINVYRSGYATFEGRSNVELEGMHHARIGRDTLEVILKEAETLGFFELLDKYDSNVTDLPSSILRVVGGGRDKRVVARVGTPANFKVLFEKAEGLLFPVAWRPMPASE